jgi:hypothetical protein
MVKIGVILHLSYGSNFYPIENYMGYFTPIFIWGKNQEWCKNYSHGRGRNYPI